MALYALSDTHLSLTVEKPMDIFGSRWLCYTEKLEEGWRELVTDGDTVVVAGDISWGMNLRESLDDLRFLDRLPGRKLIGRGNHDYWWETLGKMNAFLDENGITTLKFLYNNSFVTEGYRVCGSRGWFSDKKAAPDDSDYKKIVARECQRIARSLTAEPERLDGSEERERLLFLHFPPVYGDFVCREILDTLHEYDVRRCFFGHIHTVYDIPPSFVYEGIEFTITSSDYLHFYPLLIE